MAGRQAHCVIASTMSESYGLSVTAFAARLFDICAERSCRAEISNGANFRPYKYRISLPENVGTRIEIILLRARCVKVLSFPR